MFNDTKFNYSTFIFNSGSALNPEIHTKFLELNKHTDIQRSHFFNNRYENIYIDKILIPELASVLQFANQCAQKTLQLSINLDIGFWFNDMPPTSVTLPHTHDDDDEMLSGVYYVSVPQDSGNLILLNNSDKKTITPKEGQLILFKADCLHEVSVNNSQHHRLSIGMNFGLKSKQC